MDLLQQCAQEFDRLIPYQYHIIIGRKGKTLGFILSSVIIPKQIPFPPFTQTISCKMILMVYQFIYFWHNVPMEIHRYAAHLFQKQGRTTQKDSRVIPYSRKKKRTYYQ